MLPAMLVADRASSASQTSMVSSPLARQPRVAVPARSHRARRALLGAGRMSGADEATESVAVGWVRVGGADFLGGKVSVDGVPIGFAPLEHALPVGVHSLTIVSPGSGHPLVRQLIRVGGHHTRVRPLSLLR
jgi:hypothetical protein